MFEAIRGEPNNLTPYRGIIKNELYAELEQLSRDLKGLRILHINSNSKRGGVAEILHREIPLLNGLGLSAEWQTFSVPDDVYAITKAVHNGLQGSSQPLSKSNWARYESFNKDLARGLKHKGWDVIVVHDHQPAAMLSFINKDANTRWLWRCHVDTTSPNPVYAKRVKKYSTHFDGAIYHTKEHVLGQFDRKRVLISPVGIDPLSPKNLPMSQKEARDIVRSFGVDTGRPFISQLCRFDPWKDIPAAIRAWQIAKISVPGLQLVISGAVSANDQQGQKILAHVRSLIKSHPDVYLLVNKVTGKNVKAFLTASDVILHKSIREGFGLNVSEALWSGTPVIGSRAGGLQLQIKDARSGYLVNDTGGFAKKIITLVKDKDKAAQMGRFGREHVKKHFLLPRLVRDELRFIRQLL